MHRSTTAMLSAAALAASLSACTVGDADPLGAEGDPSPGGKADSLERGDDFSMDCWDGTFMYNRLELTERGSDVDVHLAGTQVRIAGLDSDEFAQSSVDFTLPREACVQSDTEPALWSCTATNVHVTSREQPGTPGGEVTLAFLELTTERTSVTDAFGETRDVGIPLTVTTQQSPDDPWETSYSVTFPHSLGAQVGCQM